MGRKGFNLMTFWVFFWLLVELFVAYVLGPKFLFFEDEHIKLAFHNGILIGIFSFVAIIIFFLVYTIPIYGYVTGKARADRRVVVKRTFDVSIYLSIFAFIVTGILPMAFLYLRLETALANDSFYPFILWVFASSVAYSMVVLAGLDLYSTYIAETLKIAKRERYGFFKRSLKYELPIGVITTVLFSVIYTTLIEYGAFSKYTASMSALIGNNFPDFHKIAIQSRGHYIANMLVFSITLLIVVTIAVSLEGIKRSKALKVLKDVFPKVQDGYLNVRAYSLTPDEIGSMVLYLNEMIERNAQIVKNIKKTVELVNKLSEQIKASIDTSFSSVMEQTGAVGELSAAAQELEKTSDEIHAFISHVAKFAEETSDKIFRANTVMQETLDKYSKLIAWIQTISDEIVSLEQKSSGIVEIVRTIQNIARETRILSVNAAIEAEAAGESGRRFTIVAEEIRKLAGDSDRAARNIENLAREISEIINKAVVNFENSLVEASTGEDKIKETRDYLKEIIESSRLIRDWTNEATQYTNEEKKSSENVALAAANLNSAIKNLSASAKQIATAYEELIKAVRSLVNDTAGFKI